MDQIKRQVNIKISRHYTITADTEEEFEKIKEGYCKRIARMFMKGTHNTKNGNCFMPVGNCAFVTAEVLNDAKSNFSFVVAEKTD